MSFYTDIVKKDRSLMLIIMSFHKTKIRRKYDKVMKDIKDLNNVRYSKSENLEMKGRGQAQCS